MGPPGFDPVSNSQDPLVRAPKVAVEKQDDKSAIVAATFRSYNDKSITVRYDLVRERGAWKIDDIRGTVDGEEWSVRKMMRDFLTLMKELKEKEMKERGLKKKPG